MKDFWQTHELDEGSVGYWKVGPLKLFITHYPNEWKLSWLLSKDSLDETFEKTIPYTSNKFPDDILIKRFGFNKTSKELSIMPIAPDRAIVARPEHPFIIPPKEKTVLYVSFPIWVQLNVNSPPKQIEELPTYIISDTWFGPSTISGELCYSIKTSARLRLCDLPKRPYRAITAISINNNNKDPLPIERLKLPVTHLSLYKSENGLLFTESVNFEKTKSGEDVHVKLSKIPYHDAGKTQRICPPRRPLEENIFTRAVETLFC